MYTLAREAKLNYQILNDVIEYNEKNKERLQELENYYIGNHKIKERQKLDSLKNNKIVVNHAKYITDTNIDYQVSSENGQHTYDIQPVLDAYKKQTINDLDMEIAKDVSIFGYQYEYVYINENAEPCSCEIDNNNAILVYDDSVEHKKLFGLIYRPIYEGNIFKYWDIIFVDDKQETHYKSYNKRLTKQGESKPHAFGAVPLICYKNNPELMGDFEPVMSSIDAYNTLQSDRLNDKEQLVDAILCMYGMDFDAEQADMLKESRMLANIPSDGKVEYLVKTLHENDVDILRQNYENDIHKISMVPNMSDANFVGNASGVAIRYKLLSFEQNIKNKERYMEKGLMERFQLYNNFLVKISKMQPVPIEEVDAVFKRNLPSNDFETSQMINNLSDYLCSETLISQLSFIKDASEEVELKKSEDVENSDRLYDVDYSNNEMTDQNTGVVDDEIR